jgi:hypothetical protein
MDKKLIWQREKERVNQLTDPLGKKVDRGIKSLVAALNVLGFPTVASCEGHTNWGLPFPWVEIAAKNQPEERFVGEKALLEKIAKERGIPLEELKRGRPVEVWKKEIYPNFKEETEEYKKWRKANQRLKRKLEKLLDEFYQKREVPENVRIITEEVGVYGFRIRPKGISKRPYDMNKKELKKEIQWLPRYKKEAKDLAAFLKKKFFAKSR